MSKPVFTKSIPCFRASVTISSSVMVVSPPPPPGWSVSSLAALSSPSSYTLASMNLTLDRLRNLLCAVSSLVCTDAARSANLSILSRSWAERDRMFWETSWRTRRRASSLARLHDVESVISWDNTQLSPILQPRHRCPECLAVSEPGRAAETGPGGSMTAR